MSNPLKAAVLHFAEKVPFAQKGLRRYRRWRLDRRNSLRRPVSDRNWRVFNLELTNRCPFSCIMCARTNNMKREQGLMTFETFKTIVDEYAAANPQAAATEPTWLHHFGESLVHPEFAKFMRYAVSKGIRASMSINPLMLTPAVAKDLLEAEPFMLTVSLDGHDDESFEKIRGVPHAYEKSKKNLLDFLKLKVAMGSKTFISLSMIDFSMNKDSIAKMKAYWESVPGIDEFTAKEFRVWNGDAADVNVFAVKPVDNSERRKRFKSAACGVPWEKMSVAYDGDVVPCCYDYDKKYVLGNVHKRKLGEIWNGKEMQDLRREFLSNDVKNPLCRNCPELYPEDE